MRRKFRVISNDRTRREPDDAAQTERDRRRMYENLAAAIIVTVLLVFGAWLIDELRKGGKLRACLEAGHRNCAPLEIEGGNRQ